MRGIRPSTVHLDAVGCGIEQGANERSLGILLMQGRGVLGPGLRQFARQVLVAPPHPGAGDATCGTENRQAEQGGVRC